MSNHPYLEQQHNRQVGDISLTQASTQQTTGTEGTCSSNSLFSVTSFKESNGNTARLTQLLQVGLILYVVVTLYAFFNGECISVPENLVCASLGLFSLWLHKRNCAWMVVFTGMMTYKTMINVIRWYNGSTLYVNPFVVRFHPYSWIEIVIAMFESIVTIAAWFYARRSLFKSEVSSLSDSIAEVQGNISSPINVPSVYLPTTPSLGMPIQQPSVLQTNGV